ERQLRVQSSHRLTQRRNGAYGVDCRSHDDIDATEPGCEEAVRDLGERHPDLGPWLAIDTAVPDIGYDADNGPPVIVGVGVSHLESRTDHGTRFNVFLREISCDYRDRLAIRVGLREVAALDQRSADGDKVPPGHTANARDRRVDTRCRGRAVHCEDVLEV